jgi:hypothetical protein
MRQHVLGFLIAITMFGGSVLGRYVVVPSSIPVQTDTSAASPVFPNMDELTVVDRVLESNFLKPVESAPFFDIELPSAIEPIAVISREYVHVTDHPAAFWKARLALRQEVWPNRVAAVMRMDELVAHRAAAARHGETPSWVAFTNGSMVYVLWVPSVAPVVESPAQLACEIREALDRNLNSYRRA